MATYTDDFESGFGNWSNVGGDDRDWSRDSNGTGSNNTGPSAGNGGSTWYVYTETSNPVSSGDVFLLEGPSLNELGGTIQFYVHMYGATMGNLYLEYYDGDSWEEIWSQLGEGAQTDETDPYTEVNETIPVGAQQVRFRYTAGSSFTGDCALDDIEIIENELEITEGKFVQGVLIT